MLKQPKTRKLSSKTVAETLDSNGKPYQLEYPDEQFYQYPGYPNYFVSQYANVISTAGDYPKQLKPYKRNHYLALRISNKKNTKQLYLHTIVAEVWVEKPSFYMKCPLEIHHKKKIRSNSSNIHYASNLTYVYKPYHMILDQIKSMQIKTKSGSYKYMQEVKQIADYFKVSEELIFNLLKKKPFDVQGKVEIYRLENIEIKVKKYKGDASNE